MPKYLVKRDGYWHFFRRVPESIKHLDKRVTVRQSTGIAVADDPRGIRAARLVPQMNGELEAYWRGIIDGRAAEAEIRYNAARKRARAFGFDYAPVRDLVERSEKELAERVSQLIRQKAVDDETAIAAVLGGEEPPVIMLSQLFAKFEKAERASLADMSADQNRKWANPKKKALSNLISVIGDKPLHMLTRADALDFREWWQERIVSENLDPGTANKDIGTLNKMTRIVDRLQRLGLDLVFSQMRIEGEISRQRTAYDPAFVQEHILKPEALDGLNEEAQAVIYLVSETGLRLSEAVNLTSETIHLTGEIPFVQVRPDGRRMKTDDSARDIPLVGIALQAMRMFPEGFPRYRDKGAGLSAIVNKVLKLRGLRPSPAHSLYSLRHTFEDRLTAVEAPEKVIASLMGHKWIRPKYGLGPTLKQKREWLLKIAFPVQV